MTFRIPEIFWLRSSVFNKGYEGKWITATGTAGFQRKKRAKASWRIINKWFYIGA